MQVLLIKAVPKLGLPGDVKTVANGYARNYLLPQGLAVLPNDPQARELRANLDAARTAAEAAKAKAEAKAKEWAGKTVTITAKATGDGTLYAAVTEKDVAKELGLATKLVHFQPAKTVGSYEGRVDLGEGVDAPIQVEVKGKK